MTIPTMVYLYGTALAIVTVLACKLLPRIILKQYHEPYSSAQLKTFLFVENIALLVYYVGVVIYLYQYHNLGLDFFWNVDIGNNSGANYTPIAKSVEPFVLVNSFWYIGLFATLFVGPIRKSDWTEMFCHHVATLVLIYFAYLSHWRMASLWVLSINLVCDIFVQLSRIAHQRNHWLETPFFAVFVAIHGYLRVYMYPIRIYTAVSANTTVFSTFVEHATNAATVPLFILYVYWMIRMLNICYRRLWLGERKLDYSEPKSD